MSQSIYCHEFPNGLVLVAEAMQSLESAAFTLAVPAGAVFDPADRGGLAGFVSELLMRGAGQRDNRQIINDLDNLGVDHGESVSAVHAYFTGATVAANLAPALRIFADILRRPWLPEDQLEACRQTLLQNLLGLEDDPGHKVMAELGRRHYPDPWGRPPEGDEAGVQGTTLEDVRRQWQRLYRPQGMIVSVAGRIDIPAVRDLVGELFGDWQAADVPLPAEGQRGPRAEHLFDDTNQTHIGVAYDSVPYRHPDYFQAWGAVGVLSGGMSSRLFTEVREKRGLCYSVFATTHSLRDRGSVVCYAGTSADLANETLRVLLAELRRLGEGVLPDELNRLKARMKSSLIMQQESSSARSSAMARDWYHLGRVRTLDELSAIVDGLSAESISGYLKNHPPGDMTIVTLGPKPLEIA